jgi:N-acetylglucosaminyl-diphospho-decaprenol L-rhamnosyltransferase
MRQPAAAGCRLPEKHRNLKLAVFFGVGHPYDGPTAFQAALQGFIFGMDTTGLSIIIVSWNTKDLLRQCLEHIFKGDPGIPIEVIVVDNASTDGSPDMVKTEFPRVRLLRNAENLGFSKANNLAIPDAAGEYVLLLNSDTIVKETTLFKEWVSFMDDHREAGASGCKLVYPDGTHQVGDGGFRPSLKSLFVYATFLSRVFPRRFRGLFLGATGTDRVTEVDWVSGAAFMVRKSILPDTGLLNEDIFMFAEDIEWGCRIRSLGHSVYYLPYIEITHLQGASIKRHEDRKRMSFLWIESMRYVYSMLNRTRTLWPFDILLSFSFLIRAMLYFLFSCFVANGEARTRSRIMFHSFLFALSRMGKPATTKRG